MADYDLLVIGGGTAGLVAAAGGASLGAKVALVERDKLGGECLNYGCVPTKALIRSAKVASLMRRAPEFGVRPVPVEVDFPAVMRRMRAAMEEAGERDSPERFRSLGVDVKLGEEATFVSPREVSVGGRLLSARSAIVATGSHAKPPPVEGLREAGYLDNVSVLGLQRLPASMVIVGAGPIGTEFAQMFARFGCRVELICSGDNPLPIEEPEVGGAVVRALAADGVNLHRGYRAVSARREDGERVVVARNETGEEVELRGEEILVAAGRAPTVDGLGLENAGVEVGKEGLVVDERLQTTAEGIYAAGDITGGPRFTHAAEYMARIALQNALFPIKGKTDFSTVPWTTFTDPEVARVGLTESEAREKHDGVETYTHDLPDLDRAIVDGEGNGFFKIVTGRRGRILGGHAVAPDAGDVIAEVVLAMRKGLPITDLSRTVHVYPTISEGVKGAADSYYRRKLFGGRARKALGAYFTVRRLVDDRRRKGSKV
ncbi:dihydrolipoyl dehydrogenase family protein [Rubrobacter marinus]|uniref:dihydrolipoyl dehydrogenase family protein n=1 Tax=Rubrobacter marinus TaxID=2653852 RepID=UPI00140BE476|nr:FAD-dependent oxidoreductase [Rubrobacter marinus]